MTHQLDIADVDTQHQTSGGDGINSRINQKCNDNSGTGAVDSALSHSTVTASVRNVDSSLIPGVSKTQLLKPSSDVDDIFADSSLFVSCKCAYHVHVLFCTWV